MSNCPPNCALCMSEGEEGEEEEGAEVEGDTSASVAKEPTGVKFTPEQFRKMHQCPTCGVVLQTEQREICDICEAEDLKHCVVCEIILRNKPKKYFTYDIREEYRDNGVEFKPSKELVIEFTYIREPVYPAFSEDICVGCLGWTRGIKNRCYSCFRSFKNNPFHYMVHGNACIDCAEVAEIKIHMAKNDKKFTYN